MPKVNAHTAFIIVKIPYSIVNFVFCVIAQNNLFFFKLLFLRKSCNCINSITSITLKINMEDGYKYIKAHILPNTILFLQPAAPKPLSAAIVMPPILKNNGNTRLKKKNQNA